MVLASEEIAQQIRENLINPNDIRDGVSADTHSLLSIIGDALTLVTEAESSKKDAISRVMDRCREELEKTQLHDRQQRLRRAKERLLISLTSAIVLGGITGILLYRGASIWMWVSCGVFTMAAAAGLVHSWRTIRRQPKVSDSGDFGTNVPTSILTDALKKDQAFRSAVSAVSAARALYMQRLEEGVRQSARLLINQRLEDSYETILRPQLAPGLSEFSNPAREISTEARNRLAHMIDTRSAASIGIAGRRGAGKSTLLRATTRDEAQGNAGSTLVVLASAPVQYSTREFVLHLFSVTCREVLKHQGVPEFHRTPTRPGADLETARKKRILREYGIAAARLLAPTSLLIGAALLLTSMLASFASGPRERALLMVAALLSAAVQGLFAWSAARWRAVNYDDDDDHRLRDFDNDPRMIYHMRTISRVHLAASLVSMLIAYTLALSLFIVIASLKLALIGATLVGLGAGLVGLLVNGRRSVLGSVRRERSRSYHSPEEPSESHLIETTREHLDRIAFQRSIQSGWTTQAKISALKVAEVSGGLTGSRTLSEIARGFPEIVDDFRHYAEMVTDTYTKLIIGIDELDKIEDGSLARQFLNELKGIFGLPNCYFLVTVSEDALISFERRGATVRDVFDSSFDEIVEVPPLSLKECYDLLYSRVFGVPRPFMALAYVLAGGIARDVIRHTRTLLEMADNSASKSVQLINAAALVLTEEVNSSRRGTLHAMSTFAQDGFQPAWASMLAPLKSGELWDFENALESLKQLHSRIAEIQSEYDPPKGLTLVLNRRLRTSICALRRCACSARSVIRKTSG
jgi:hypothetical protein